MDGRLFNKLLTDIISLWANDIFLPTSIDLLWQLEQEAVAFWVNQQILTKSHYILSSTINIIFFFPKGSYFYLPGERRQLIYDFEKYDKSPKLLELTSKFIFLFWSGEKLGNSAFG